MSLPTWTPGALSSEAGILSGQCWRVVEAQHIVSTLKLVDNLAEQSLLEDMIEDTKPNLPEDCRHLDYLLATPFRYGAYPNGSRFRRAGHTLGVYYASEKSETAIAEVVFYRLLFFAESPDTPWPKEAGEYTAFVVDFKTDRGLDLTVSPLDADKLSWTALLDYEPSQALADAARVGGIEAIRYQSVRDPNQGSNFALLSCRLFTEARPSERQTWRLQLGPFGVSAIREFPLYKISFSQESFAADLRIAGMNWQR